MNDVDPTILARFRCCVPLIAWVVCFLALSSTQGAAQEPISKEYRLKAAFLYNFTKFVEWSETKLGPPGSPISIGVLGTSPFGSSLEEAVLDRTVNGRAINIKRVSSIPAARSVHLLFVSETEDARLPELRDALKNTGVVTVGESAAFAKHGGVIQFAIDGDKVRFDINVAAAEWTGVKISAQLQKLARTVRR